MKNKLWKFIDGQGTFSSDSAHRINTLYLPLVNSAPLISSITPDLHGDIKTSNNTFLLEPVSRIDLANSKISRNFWVYFKPEKVWSVTGVSKDLAALKNDRLRLLAGLLWQTITRENRFIGLSSEITSFVPASGEPVEIMQVTLTNISGLELKFTPYAAIPIYGRSADNLRDHRQVTSLLNRIALDRFGVTLTPTLLFDEAGHKKNDTTYFVFGADEMGNSPEHIYPTQEAFCGEGGDLEAPEAVYNNILPDKGTLIQGKEAMAGLRFREQKLACRESYTYIIVLGIAPRNKSPQAIFSRFDNVEKIRFALQETKAYWQEKSAKIKTDTSNPSFDNWLRWVNIQPALRKISGCSFLPDFDYGKGGRGWRDLWQDCLALTLNHPEEIRAQIVNNFSGVRIDGSNATIIGQKPGEFIADRNNLCRVWMDHGIWPLVTTALYIHQTGDLKILLEQTGYFRDGQLARSRAIDRDWKPEEGNTLRAKNGKAYSGTILEHILVENLVQFFNVGAHNFIRLEGADWNDGLDMASDNGESVAFSSMYAGNLNRLCELLVKLGESKITVFRELRPLLDSLSKNPLNYAAISDKEKLLAGYFKSAQPRISGGTITIPIKKIILDLKRKADWLTNHICKNAWLKEGFFNGYFDEKENRVEGNVRGKLRMGLTGQVFPILSGIATDKQIKSIFQKACANLKNQRWGGFHLNTDFKQEHYSLGRAFSFVYGEKENGAYFSHMSVMFAYGLYARGFANEGYMVLDSLFGMANNSQTSKIYPCLPEYFNAEGRGMYSYLTGSASWYMFTLLTQAFGVRGEFGDLLIEPKLTAAQFKNSPEISISASFAGCRLKIVFANPYKKEFPNYAIQKISLNDSPVANDIHLCRYLLPRRELLSLANQELNLLKISLG